MVTAAGVPTPSTPPLTIAYVGNFRAAWCTEVHVAGSLEALGHRVIRCQEDEVEWSALARWVGDAGAQMLLWTRTWHVDLDDGRAALEHLRARGIPSVSYHLDRWWGLDREHQIHEEPFFRTDLVVSPDGAHDDDWAAAGVTHLYLPPGVYHAECEPVPARPQRYPHPVIFVGSHPYPHPEWAPYRAELIDTLAAYFGPRFHVYPGPKRRPVRGRQLQELYASASVVVGDSCLAGGATRYWSDRIPETLGRGGLLIHPYVEGLSDWYPSMDTHGPRSDDEIPPALMTYDLGEFRQVIDLAEWALERTEVSRRIAEEGRGIVLGRDTYAHRLNTVLEHVGRAHGFRDAPQASTGRAQRRPGAPTARARPNGRRDRRAAVRPPENLGRGAVHAFTPGRRSAWFVPRDPDGMDVDLDAASGAFEVVEEVWTRNDYDLPDIIRGTVVDLGANVGAFTVLAAVSGATRVVAVEPDPGNLERLRFHVELNGVADRVEVLSCAVSVGERAVALVGEGSAVHRFTGGDESPLMVPAVRLVDLLATYEPIRFLKMDIEGAEFDIIADTPTDALRAVEEIALEWHGPAMPHLGHLGGDEFGAMVTKLADAGRVSTFGHPSRGGLLHWRRY